MSARSWSRPRNGGGRWAIPFPGELRLLALLLGAGVGLFLLSRIAFLMLFSDRFRHVPLGTTAAALVVGMGLDLSLLGWLLLPVWGLCFLPRWNWRDRAWARRLLVAWIGGCTFLLVLGVVSDLAHYREYDVRLNGTSLDYVRQPGHLLVVLHHEFALLPALLLLSCLSWGAARGLARAAARFAADAPLVRRLVPACGALAALLLLCGSAASGATWGSSAYFSHNYVADQLALNGPYNLALACVSELADDAAIEERLLAAGDDPEGAVLRELSVGACDTPLGDPSAPLLRVTDTGRPERPLNVVVLLLESFDASGIGCLGGEPGLSPRFDALAEEGLLFTQVHAVGTRTNRGLAGVISSVPGLPGLSPLRGPAARDLRSVADVLRERGYATVAVHGGERHYDAMDEYLLGNGFERFVALESFPGPSFRTEWGVSDEEVLDRALEEFRALGAAERPFLGLVLTLSNHRPYRVPEGRVEPAAGDDRDAEMDTAFRYADWALGRFLDAARSEPWARDTVFVLVADHGRALCNRAVLDVSSFRVPLLLWSPGIVEPGRVDDVGSQLDVAPTVMGLLGGRYEHSFFGRDLLGPDPPRRAVMALGDYLIWHEPGRVAVWPPDDEPELYAYTGGAPRPVPRTPAEQFLLDTFRSRLVAVSREAFAVTRGRPPAR